MSTSSSQTTYGPCSSSAAGVSGTNRVPCTEASPATPPAKTAAAGPTAAGISIKDSSDGWIGVSRSRQQRDLSSQQQYDHPGGKLVKHLKDLRAVQVGGWSCCCLSSVGFYHYDSTIALFDLTVYAINTLLGYGM
jgi:hypothetical protein